MDAIKLLVCFKCGSRVQGKENLLISRNLEEGRKEGRKERKKDLALKQPIKRCNSLIYLNIIENGKNSVATAVYR